MFQKKPVYIIGTILFSLILIAFLLLYLFIPKNQTQNILSGFGGMTPGGSSSGSSGFESLEGNDTNNGGFSRFEDFGGDFPGQGDWESMGPNMENGNFPMPENMELPDGIELPTGFDTWGGGRQFGMMSLISILQSAFWSVLVVCVLGNGVCIFMLITISRKKKASHKQAANDEEA